MDSETFVFDAPYPGGLKIVAKRYTQGASSTNESGVTLIFTHCIGSHKEQWEPILERLFHLQSRKATDVQVREAWGFDWQSHGDSAVVNREALKSREDCVSVFEWWPALVDFVKSPRMERHKIVALGHSAGAAAVLLTTKGLSMDTNPYRAIILIEPTVVNREVFQTSIEERLAEMEFVVSATSSRKDNWRSKEAALEYFQKRLPWKFWDKRVVRLLSEYGLDDSSAEGVILKCDKRHEALSYPDVEPHFEAAIQIANVGRLVPIHLIWGTRNELVPEYFQEALCDASAGRIIASVTKVKGGHFLVQERPDEVADVIAGILDGLPGKSAGQVPLSKL